MLTPTRFVPSFRLSASPADAARRSAVRGLATVWMLLFLAVAGAFAQGTISGRVSNATTGANLEGAEVSITLPEAA